MKKKYDILTPLDICVDLILTGNVQPEFGQKEKIVDDYIIEMGGSNCIFACQAAKLGMRVAGIGVSGDDLFGELVRKSLNNAGVDTSHVITDSSYKTAIGIALCENGDRAILTYLGTIAATGLESTLSNVLPETRHLHIGSFYLMDGLRPYWLDIVKSAKDMGVTVSLDTNWDPSGTWQGLNELLPYVDVFFPNENEALHITKEKNEIDAVHVLLKSVGIVVLKKGKDGAKVFTRCGKLFSLPSISIKVVDAIGAGDSFAAGFLNGFINSENHELCLKKAIICGSMSTRGAGGVARQATIEEVCDLL